MSQTTTQTRQCRPRRLCDHRKSKRRGLSKENIGRTCRLGHGKDTPNSIILFVYSNSMQSFSPSRSKGRSSSPPVKSYASSTPGPAPMTKDKIIIPNKKAHIKRNKNGGLHVRSEDLASLFAIFDPEQRGTISIKSLKKSLSVFFPEMTSSDYRFIMDNKNEINIEDLKMLLMDNDLINFDPCVEAFKAFDSDRVGHLSASRLREVLSACQFGDLTEEEAKILIHVSDLDEDGKVGFDDFQGMIERTVTKGAVGEPSGRKASTGGGGVDSDDGSPTAAGARRSSSVYARSPTEAPP